MDIIEGHPIPQDITGFQFRIIGDLTIKQFAYLAVGLLLAWLIFIIPFPLFIKIPFAALFAGIGIIFAFVPIQGRPADTMLLLFFRAVMHANEYSYDKKHAAQLLQQTQNMQQQPDTTPNVVPQEISSASVPSDTPSDLPPVEKAPEEHTTQFAQVLAEKQRLEEQLLLLQQQLQQKQQPAPLQPVLAEKKQQAPSEDKTLPGIQRTPDSPNVLLGTVKDARGNPLPNILIEVKDKDDNPVRAFKTNPQGVFASATPLVNGSYTVVFEDPKKHQQFADITVEATGDILPPLEVASVDDRENLRKSLFGG